MLGRAADSCSTALPCTPDEIRTRKFRRERAVGLTISPTGAGRKERDSDPQYALRRTSGFQPGGPSDAQPFHVDNYCMKRINDAFDTFSDFVAEHVSHAWFFFLCLIGVAAWIIGLPIAGWKNDIYHLMLNSPTTAITFLLVALLHNTQHRAERALHRKLDLLMRFARDQCSDEELCKEMDDLMGTEAVASKEE